ncbi:hypothetical protein A7E77_13415 [Sphingomonas sp. NIC1]|nr:hypothetical protein A7E77_13415 [Sphingomonas sp. NIC1]
MVGLLEVSHGCPQALMRPRLRLSRETARAQEPLIRARAAMRAREAPPTGGKAGLRSALSRFGFLQQK